jgi:hypothetical protein
MTSFSIRETNEFVTVRDAVNRMPKTASLLVPEGELEYWTNWAAITLVPVVK